MNPEIKTKWVEALRSGEFQQGKGALNKAADNTFCCLGVLCEIAKNEGVVESFRYPGSDFIRYGNTEHSSMSYLPDEVVEWAGMEGSDSYNPKVTHPVNGSITHLAVLNDDEGKTFEEIADVIEASL